MPVLSQPGEPIWSELSAEVHQILVADLARIDQLWKRLDVIITTPPAAGSAAEIELANKSQAYAHLLAGTALRSALDHLLAWRRLLSAGLTPTYAHMSLLRTAHESALLAYWLLEPGADALTRQARGIAAQAEDFKERHNFEKAIDRTTPPPKGKLAKDRLTDLITPATQLGLTKLDKNGKEVLKTAVPGMVELFDLYEPEKPPRKGNGVIGFTPGTPMQSSGQWSSVPSQWLLTMLPDRPSPFTGAGPDRRGRYSKVCSRSRLCDQRLRTATDVTVGEQAQSWLLLPWRVYLDTSALQSLHDFGGQVFEGALRTGGPGWKGSGSGRRARCTADDLRGERAWECLSSS